MKIKKLMSTLLKILTSSEVYRPTWDELFMSNALLFSTRSSCKRLHVGCVIVKDNHVISSGYNGYPSGVPHVSCVRDNHEQNTVHAEVNCIADCAKRGITTKLSTAYITHYPCLNCTKLLISAGISKIIYLSNYKNDPLVDEMIYKTKDRTDGQVEIYQMTQEDISRSNNPPSLESKNDSVIEMYNSVPVPVPIPVPVPVFPNNNDYFFRN